MPTSEIRVGFLGLAGQVYYALPLATTKRHDAWGREVWTIELRGWISAPGNPNPDDPDLSYELEVDVSWVLGRGIDPSELLRVGNILGIGVGDPGAPTLASSRTKARVPRTASCPVALRSGRSAS